MGRKVVKQRMVFMCDLPIGDGSEFSGVHPCLVASIDLRNNCSPNVYVFPITHSNLKYQPTHYTLTQDKYDFFNFEENTVICEEGRSISRSRLQRYMGEISDDDFSKILKHKDFVFYEKKNGVPFETIVLRQAFKYIDDIYIKIQVKGTNKYKAFSLTNCESQDFDNDILVIPLNSIQRTLDNAEKSIRNKYDKNNT